MTSAEASRYVSDKIVHKAVDAVGSATYPVDGGPWMVQEFRVGLEAVAGDIAAAVRREDADLVRRYAATLTTEPEPYVSAVGLRNIADDLETQL